MWSLSIFRRATGNIRGLIGSRACLTCTKPLGLTPTLYKKWVQCHTPATSHSTGGRTRIRSSRSSSDTQIGGHPKIQETLCLRTEQNPTTTNQNHENGDGICLNRVTNLRISKAPVHWIHLQTWGLQTQGSFWVKFVSDS